MLSNETTEITVTFFKRLFRSDDENFCIGMYQQGKGSRAEYITCKGANLPELHFPVTFSGQWVNDPKFGRQFQVEWVVSQLPNDNKDMADFITAMKIGIGPKRAQRMIDLVGADKFWDTVQNDPEVFLKVNGINECVIQKLKNKIVTLTYQKALLQYFHSDLKLDGNRYKRLCTMFQGKLDEMLPTIQKNPFVLLQAGFHFREVDYFCSRNTHFLLTDTRRMTAATIQVLLDAQQQSHVGLPVEQMPTQLRSILSFCGGVSLEDCTFFLNEMLDSKYVTCDNAMYYLTRTYQEERQMANSILERLSAPKRIISKVDADAALAEYGNEKGFELSPDQKNAIYGALTDHFCIVTGGPGTGKSTILDALLVCWKKFVKADDWVLMAPTGKAAVRMTETTGETAGTIHSMLKLSVSDTPLDPEVKTLEPLPVEKGLVIIDEASMLDQPVMSALLKAVTKQQHFILVGDPEQLPSVGYGNVLADLISSGVVPVYRLNTIYRQAAGNPIITNSTKMQKGETELDWSNKSFRRYNHGSDEENMKIACKFFMRCVNQFGIKKVAMLSPYHRNNPISTDSMNKVLQDAFNPDKGQPSIKSMGQTLRFGDRVMQLKNTESVSNGDTGTICQVQPNAAADEHCLWVKFDTGLTIPYTKDDLNQLELAYAFTVHKSQGSQYPCVVMILPQKRTPFLKRNLLYTGITRASKYVAIVSPTVTIDYMIQNCKTDDRYTTLVQLLQEKEHLQGAA